MAAETRATTETPGQPGNNVGQADTSRAEISGLDALELGPDLRDHGLVRFGLAAWRTTWPKVLALALVIGAWQVLYWAEWKPRWVLPPPEQVFRDLAEFVPTAQFWTAVAITMQRALTGFALAIVVGVVVGTAVARFKPLRAAIGSLITGLQTMPSVLWFMPGILLFGISETTILFVVILGAAPSIANGLIGGIDYVPPAWLRAGKVLGMRGLLLYRHVILPASLPSFLSGLKQGWAFAWRSLMAGELLVVVAGQGSIGALLQGARELADITRTLTWIMVVLIIGVLVDIGFKTIDNTLRRRWGLKVD